MEFGQQRRTHWLASVQLSDAVAAAAVAAAAIAATALATVVAAAAVAAVAAITASGASAVRRRRRIHLHRGGDLLLDGHVAHRNRRRGAWLHALHVGLPHADRLCVGSRL
jgi:MoxR-like ATPase